MIYNIVGAIAAFGLLAGVWVAILLVVSLRKASRQRTMEERLGVQGDAKGPGRVLRLWHEGQVATTVVPSATSPSAWALRLRTLHRAAGFEAEFKAVLTGVAGGMLLAGALLFAFTHNAVL